MLYAAADQPLTALCTLRPSSPLACRRDSTTQRKAVEWKEHLRPLVAILAAEEGAPDGQMLVPLDTDMCRRMLDVKAAALLVLRLVATDHDRVVEAGRCGGFRVRVTFDLISGVWCQVFFVCGRFWFSLVWVVRWGRRNACVLGFDLRGMVSSVFCAWTLLVLRC